MEKKYKLTDEILKIGCHILHRIVALRDFGNIKKGDLGGFIEKEANLADDGNCWIFDNADVARLVGDINPKHIEALIALNKLFTIAQAWNKEDGFVPNFSDWEQDKWFPWFKYDKDVAKFVCADTINAATAASAHLGSRLCFKTKTRAEQFGKQFADLYNKVFL